MAPSFNVYIDNNGFFYKAEKATDASHAQRPVITQEFLDALPDDGTPMLIVDVEAKVQKILEERKLSDGNSGG